MTISRRFLGASQVAANKLVIGSVSPDHPQTVDEIVFEMDFEDGVVNPDIEYARAKFIVTAVNNYYGKQSGGPSLAKAESIARVLRNRQQ